DEPGRSPRRRSREFPMAAGHGDADYLLFVDRKAVGVVEAEKAGSTLTGVEWQSAKYTAGFPDTVPALTKPLAFAYESTGVETRFTNAFDPEPASRQMFTFYLGGERVARGKLHIEHVMPRKWELHWPDPDGQRSASDRDRLIHTIGNLTLLTGRLNAKVSN